MRLAFAIPLLIGPLFLPIINSVGTRRSPQLIAVSTNNFINSQLPQNVVFCELVKQAETYENKLVRMRASFISNFESNVLYDVDCYDKDTQVESILDCPTESLCKEIQETLGKSLKGDPFSGMRADLVMVGRLRIVKVPSEGARKRGISLTFGVTQIETTIPMPPQNPIPIY
jgi:hypothetical protein